jgi:hypothetical protein
LKYIGDRRGLAFEIAESIEGGLLEVNIWACDELLTYFDNQVHIPSFVYTMQREYSFLRTATTQQDRPFLLLGPTTDDVSGKISIDDGTAKISFTLRNGNQCSFTIEVQELTQLYEQVLNQIDFIKNA